MDHVEIREPRRRGSSRIDRETKKVLWSWPDGTLGIYDFSALPADAREQFGLNGFRTWLGLQADPEAAYAEAAAGRFLPGSRRGGISAKPKKDISQAAPGKQLREAIARVVFRTGTFASIEEARQYAYSLNPKQISQAKKVPEFLEEWRAISGRISSVENFLPKKAENSPVS